MTERLSGSCLCGAVRFSAPPPAGAPDACHCALCRKWSGHHWASADVPKAALVIEGEEHLTWYRSSDKVERGFCARCGSSLFFRPVYRDWIAYALGAVDGPTGLRLGKHIFTARKGDYYDIADGVPQDAAPPG